MPLALFSSCFLRYFHNLVLDSFLIVFGHLVWAILSIALVFTLLGLVRGRTLITMQLIILHYPHEMTLLQCYTLGLSTCITLITTLHYLRVMTSKFFNVTLLSLVLPVWYVAELLSRLCIIFMSQCHNTILSQCRNVRVPHDTGAHRLNSHLDWPPIASPQRDR